MGKRGLLIFFIILLGVFLLSFSSALDMQITNITLYNADTDKAIVNLTDGYIINYAQLGTKNISLVAIGKGVDLKSVVFSYDSTSRYQIESTRPYAIRGDNNGNLNPWTPTIGNHIVTVTPYNKTGGTGTAGTPHTITFGVVDQAIVCSDSDGGKNYNVKGSITDEHGTIKDDSCSDSKLLNEYYCNNNLGAVETYTCSYQCSDGKCIAQSSSGAGTGLNGSYYDNMDFTNLKLSRIDPTVNFDWRTNAPHSSIGADTFSIRWEGMVEPKYTEKYTFYELSNNGARVYVNNVLLVNDWVSHSSREANGSINLFAGVKYPIKVEYYEDDNNAVIKLYWSSQSQSKEIISQTKLYPKTENLVPPATLYNVSISVATLKDSYKVNEQINLTDPPDNVLTESYQNVENNKADYIYIINKSTILSEILNHPSGLNRMKSMGLVVSNDQLEFLNKNFGYIVKLKEEPLVLKDKKLKEAKKEGKKLKDELNIHKLKVENEHRNAKKKIREAIGKARQKSITGSAIVDREGFNLIAWIKKLFRRGISGYAISEDELNSKVLAEYDTVFNGIALDITEEEAREVEKLDEVEKVYPNLKVELTLMDSVPLINADDVWQINDNSGQKITGKGVKIAILDTGVDYTHPDLGGCFGSNCKVVDGYDFSDSDNDPMDYKGHGTHVAATAAGNGVLKGVAPDAKIVAYKVFPNAYYHVIMNALNYSTDPNQDGDFSDHVDVVSMSFGINCKRYYGGYTEDCGPNDALSQTVDNAVDAGVVAVVSVGNSGPEDETVASPATSRKAISVAASDKYDSIADFSSRGPIIFERETSEGIVKEGIIKPDISAPGVDICAAEWGTFASSYRCVDDRHVAISGTSMAAPHISGVVALVKQAHPGWSSEQIKAQLQNTVQRINGDIFEYGYGRVDAKKAASINTPFLNLIVMPDYTNRNIRVEISNLNNFDITSYTLKYRSLYSSEWKNLKTSSTISGVNLNIDMGTIDNGIVNFRIEAKTASGTYYKDALVYIDNFQIVQIGKNGNNYLIDNNELLKIKLNGGSYTGYNISLTKYVSEGVYIEKKIIYTSSSKLNDGDIINIDISSFVDGRYRIVLSAREDKSGKIISSEPYDVIVLKAAKGGAVGFSRYINPRYLSLANLDNKNYSILITTTNHIPISETAYRVEGPYLEVMDYTMKNNKVMNIFSNGTGTYFLRRSFGNAISKGPVEDNIFLWGYYYDRKWMAGIFNESGFFVNNWPSIFREREELGVSLTYFLLLPPPAIFNGKIFPIGLSEFDHLNDPNMTNVFPVYDDSGNLIREISYKPFYDLIGEIEWGDSVVSLAFVPENPNLLNLIEHSTDGTEKEWLVFRQFNIIDGKEIAMKKIFEVEGDISFYNPITADIDNDRLSEIIIPFGAIDKKLWNSYPDYLAYTTNFVILDSYGNIKQPIKNITGYFGGQAILTEQNGKKYIAFITFGQYSNNPNKIVILNIDGSVYSDKIIMYEDRPLKLISGDINNDGKTEIIYSTHQRDYLYSQGPSYVNVISLEGVDIKNVTLTTLVGDGVAPYEIVLNDINNDKKTDLIIGGTILGYDPIGNGTIYHIPLNSEYNKSAIYWPMYQHDAQHTNCYDCDFAARPPPKPKLPPPRPQSKIVNNGDTSLFGTITLRIDNYAGSNAWITQRAVVYKGYNLQPKEVVKLDKLWNPNNVTLAADGKYRVYAEFKHYQGKVKVNATWEFDVI